MADLSPTQRGSARGEMLVIALEPVDLLVATEQKESFEGVDAGHLRAPQPVGVEGEDADRERHRNEQRTPDEGCDHRKRE